MPIDEKIIYSSDVSSVPDFIVPYMHAHASGDFNGDGLVDLVGAFTNFGQEIKNEIKILLNDGQGGFIDGTSQLITGAIPQFYQAREIVVDDLNGDGRDDIFFANQGVDTPPNLVGEPNALLLSQSDGKYVSVELPAIDFSHSADIADLNGDGAKDIVVGNFLSAGTFSQPYILMNDGSGNFGQRVDFMPAPELANSGPQIGATLIADVNNDGKQDLVFGDWGSDQTRLYLGDGSGDFSSSVGKTLPTLTIAGQHANAADLKAFDADGDGDLDIVVSFIGAATDTNDPGSYLNRSLQLLINDGSGNFTDETTARLPLAANPGTQTPAQWFVFLETIDFNGDGQTDIVAKNLNTGGTETAADTPVLWLNVGRGYFEPFTQKSIAAQFGSNGYPGAFEVVDADGDGGRDLLTIGYRPELLRQLEPLARADGTPDDDLLLGTTSNDAIDGGAGVDKLLMSASRSEIDVAGSGSVFTVSGPDGIDQLANVEFLTLRDGTFKIEDLVSTEPPDWRTQPENIELAASTYQFFTGGIPEAEGFEFLIASSVNTADLNDPYYDQFNIENTYINFANNLGSFGEGAIEFALDFGNLTFAGTIETAFEEIIGSQAIINSGGNPQASIDFFLGAFDFYAAVAEERVVPGGVSFDQAVKVVAIGSILNEAFKADLGRYPDAVDVVTQDITLTGTTAQFGMDLFA